MVRYINGRGCVGCKHKFVIPLEGYDGQFKCSWCKKRFASSTELEEEYKRLSVPYKIRDPRCHEGIRNAIGATEYLKKQTIY